MKRCHLEGAARSLNQTGREGDGQICQGIDFRIRE
jgi:hypothetical protein